MLGGFLKHMTDSIKYNRDLIKNRKSLNDIYRQEAKKGSGHINQKDVKERVALYLKRRRKVTLISKVSSLLLLSAVIIGIYVSISNFKSSEDKESLKRRPYFNAVIYNKPANEQVKIDYYWYGPKAAETRLKNGLKHQNSESYYSSGEQFRSALYYKDSLIVDLYFFKSGDTIKNFPNVSSSEVQHIELKRSDSSKVSFDYFDGKVIYGSYLVEYQR